MLKILPIFESLVGVEHSLVPTEEETKYYVDVIRQYAKKEFQNKLYLHADDRDNLIWVLYYFYKFFSKVMKNISSVDRDIILNYMNKYLYKKEVYDAHNIEEKLRNNIIKLP